MDMAGNALCLPSVLKGTFFPSQRPHIIAVVLNTLSSRHCGSYLWWRTLLRKLRPNEYGLQNILPMRQTAQEQLLCQAEQLGNESQEQLLPSFSLVAWNHRHLMADTAYDPTGHTSVVVWKSNNLGQTGFSNALKSFCTRHSGHIMKRGRPCKNRSTLGLKAIVDYLMY
jgi:hypothetical protein